MANDPVTVLACTSSERPGPDVHPVLRVAVAAAVRQGSGDPWPCEFDDAGTVKGPLRPQTLAERFRGEVRGTDRDPDISLPAYAKALGAKVVSV